MVSLPSKWVKHHNLSKGCEVEIQEINGALMLSTEGVVEKKSTVINLTTYTESAIRTAIVNAYRGGFDVLRINFKDEKQYKEISRIIKEYTIGFDIIKRDKYHCVLENVTEPSANQFDVLFKKILQNISLLISVTESRLKGEDVYDDYKEINLKIHQYDNFCRRVIMKHKAAAGKSELFWTFLTLLVHGQRELYHLNKFLDKNKVKCGEIHLLKKLRILFDYLSEGYAKKDLGKLEKVHEIEKEIVYVDFYDLIQKGGKESIINYHLATSARKFYLASSPLVGMNLNKENSKNIER